MKTDERLSKYPSTEKFRVIDTIGIPHPYCITSRHVEIAAKHFGGVLTKESIEEAEKLGAVCDICKKSRKTIRNYFEHETALLVRATNVEDLNKDADLKPYLLSIKEMAEKDGFAGFAFTK